MTAKSFGLVFLALIVFGIAVVAVLVVVLFL